MILPLMTALPKQLISIFLQLPLENPHCWFNKSTIKSCPEKVLFSKVCNICTTTSFRSFNDNIFFVSFSISIKFGLVHISIVLLRKRSSYLWIRLGIQEKKMKLNYWNEYKETWLVKKVQGNFFLTIFRVKFERLSSMILSTF